MGVRVGTAVALGAVVACSSSGAGDQSLAFACQLETCECIPKKGTILGEETVQPVLWTEDGKAYCPDTHSLSRSGQKSDFIKRYGG